jgi:sporulation protein YlmC with PRC-barrel domain
MKKRYFSLGTAALLSALVPNIGAAEAELEAEVDVPKVETRTEVKQKGDVEANVRVDRELVKNTEKASSIIGMEVRNTKDEKLGEVKDLVIDMDSGKLSYAVLAVGGFLGIGEKLIALPPRALKTGDTSEYLLLDADKARIQAAPGFAATAWPSPEDPEVNSFWNDARATGAPGGIETRRSGNVDVDADVDTTRKDGELKIDADRGKKIYTDAETDRKVKVEVEKD